MLGTQHDENDILCSTRRNALKLAGGTITTATLGTTPATAQEEDRLQWVFDTDEYILSSPTIINGTAFIGSGDNTLYAVDADTGNQQWTLGTGGDIVLSSPTVVDGTVFVGSNDENIYSVDADTGDQQWVFETNRRVHSSPTVKRGTVYVGSFDGHLYAVDATTGDQQWAFETDNRILSSPTVVDNTVFIGSADRNLYAVDAATGDRQWAFRTESNILSSPTVHNGIVYVGGVDTNLYALDVETGDERWSTEMSDVGIYSSPTVVGDSVFVVDNDNNLYVVDIKTGDQQQILEIPEVKGANWNVSSPTVVDGTVFVGGGDGLYAVEANVSGDSEGSRVNLGTLGHHHVWADEAGDDKPRLFNLTVDAPSEAVAGSDITISVDAKAAESQISAFQIAPAEQPDHVNDFSDLAVSTTAGTQIEEPGFVVYNELQDQVTVEWTGSIPENAEGGATFTLAGDALDEPQNRQLFSHTVTVTDDPLKKYRNDNGEINDTGLLEAISDWRDGDLEDTQLLELISEWRDAGGNVETLGSGSLPNIK